VATEVKRVEFSVIAGPTRERLCNPGLSQLPHQVAIRVQDADRGHVNSGKSLLPPRFT